MNHAAHSDILQFLSYYINAGEWAEVKIGHSDDTYVKIYKHQHFRAKSSITYTLYEQYQVVQVEWVDLQEVMN